MKRPRIFAAFSTAAAAVIALTAFFFVPDGGSNRAMAATILRSLREAVHRGMTVELERLSVEGVHIDGRMDIEFSQPVTLADVMENGATPPRPAAIYAELKVVGDGNNEEISGLEADVSMALSPTDKWAFVRLTSLPDQVIREAPFAVMALNLTRNGLLFDLAALEPFADLDELFSGDAAPDDADSAEATVEEDAAAVSASVKTSVSTTIVQDDEPANAGASTALHTKGKLSVSLSDDAGNEARLESLFRDFLSGKAGTERMAELVNEIEQFAGDVNVRQLPSGDWELVARDFQTEGMDKDDVALFARSALRIRYAQGSGIREVELTNVGDAGGTIRFRFIEAISPNLLSKQRFIDQGIRPIDTNGLMKMFESFGGQMNTSEDE